MQETRAAWGADNQPEEPDVSFDGGFVLGGNTSGSGSGGGEDYDRGMNSYGENINLPQEGDYVSGISAASSAAYDLSGTGQTEGGRYGDVIGADDTGGGAADETATAASGQSSRPSTKSHAQGGGSSAGGGTRGARSGGSTGGDTSGGNSSLDRTSADELSQWSLEKLREVSKVTDASFFGGNSCLPLVLSSVLENATVRFRRACGLNRAELEVSLHTTAGPPNQTKG